MARRRPLGRPLPADEGVGRLRPDLGDQRAQVVGRQGVVLGDQSRLARPPAEIAQVDLLGKRRGLSGRANRLQPPRDFSQRDLDDDVARLGREVADLDTELRASTPGAGGIGRDAEDGEILGRVAPATDSNWISVASGKGPKFALVQLLRWKSLTTISSRRRASSGVAGASIRAANSRAALISNRCGSTSQRANSSPSASKFAEGCSKTARADAPARIRFARSPGR